jgi:hypothetical protein
MGEGTVHEHHVTYLTKHMQRPKAFSATSPCLSRSLSVSAGQAMHSGNGQIGQQKQGTSCELPTMYNIVIFYHNPNYCFDECDMVRREPGGGA